MYREPENKFEITFVGILEGNYFSGEAVLFDNGVKLENLPDQHTLFITQRYFSNAIMDVLDYLHTHGLYDFSSSKIISTKFIFSDIRAKLIQELVYAEDLV